MEETKVVYLMLDLETLATRPDAAIFSVGIHPFLEVGLGENVSALRQPQAADFYSTVPTNLQDGYVSEKTLAWWQEQDAEARKAFSEAESMTCSCTSVANEILGYLKTLIDKGYKLLIFGNGAAFDNAILKRFLCHYLGEDRVEQVWFYKADMCVRTLFAEHWDPSLRHIFDGTKHNALDDAKNQAQNLKSMMDWDALIALAEKIYRRKA